mmetsp:Transcript_27066/g.40509  ORF Transcript_27066/g.40509 Transcript_27066/m.40509 type:complete len:88 (-) Transcript_27066:13-276(-)
MEWKRLFSLYLFKEITSVSVWSLHACPTLSLLRTKHEHHPIASFSLHDSSIFSPVHIFHPVSIPFVAYTHTLERPLILHRSSEDYEG